MFYSPRDNDTKEFKDKFVKLAASLKAAGVKVGAVNCEKEPALCGKYNAAHLNRRGEMCRKSQCVTLFLNLNRKCSLTVRCPLLLRFIPSSF